MAILPTRLVEIEFTAGVWTDVSAYVVNVNTRRGRNKQTGAFETGTMTVLARNDDRRFDPDYAAGPYYGNLRPNRRIRFRMTYSATTYYVFQGYIDRITQQYSGPNDATVEIVASDMFKLLARTELPVSVYMAEVTADLPVALWRLDEPSGSTTAVDSIGPNHLTASGNVTFGAAGSVVRDPGGAVTFGAYPAFLQRTVTTMPVAATPISLELVYRRAAAGPNALLMGLAAPAGSSPGCWLGVTSTGELFFVVAPAGVTATSTGAGMNDLAAHHIVATWAASGTMKIFVDGVDKTSAPTSSAAATFNPSNELWVGNGDVMAGNADPGTYQMAAIYATDLNATRIGAHNAAMRTPWNGDTTGARLVRIEDLAQVPVGDRATDAGSTTLQSTSLGGTALAYAQKVEETEAGRLFVSRDGKFTFKSRYNADIGSYLTSKATLVDADSGAGLGYTAVTADVDEATIITRATVSRDGSVAITWNDAAAQAEFKLIDETHEGLLHNSDTYSLYYAQWIVNTHKTPVSRVGTLAMQLASNPAAYYLTVLDFELGDRVTYKRTPQNIGAVITTDMRIEAISHATGGGYWTTQLQLSPFGVGEGGWATGVWDTSLWDRAVWGL